MNSYAVAHGTRPASWDTPQARGASSLRGETRSTAVGRHTVTRTFPALATALMGAMLALPAGASTLYANALQTQADLSSWLSTKGDAEIATAPDGSRALTFAGTTAGGDIYADGDRLFASHTGSFTLSFEALGHCGAQTSGCGAFVYAAGAQGNAGGWILADTPYFALPTFAQTPGQWQQVRYTFGGSSTDLGFENWVASPYAGPHSFFIRNVVLTDNAERAAIGSLSVSAVPEPGSWLLMGLGLLALAGLAARSGARARASTPFSGFKGLRRAGLAWWVACAAWAGQPALAQGVNLDFDDNQLPAGWSLHSVLANTHYGFADGRFYAAEVDSSAYIESALTTGASSWSVSWDSALFQTVYGNFSSVTLLDASGHAFAVSVGSASYNFGEGLRVLIDDGASQHQQLLPLLAGNYRLSATFSDGQVDFSGVLSAAQGDVQVFAEAVAAPWLVASSVSAVRLQVYETIGPQVWIDNVHIAAVPEPASAATLLLGLTSLAWRARRRQQRAAAD